MNLLQLVFKQMRQRALGTWLTLLSVMLGVALAVAVLIVREGGQSVLGQTDYGYDLIVGKGSPIQLVLNTVYHIDQSPGNISYSLYEQLANPRNPRVKIAVPIIVGDTYKNRRIVATLPKMFGYDDEGNRIPEDTRAFQYRPGKRLDLAEGSRMFHPRKFEAVIGSDVPGLTGLQVGGKFKATHGAPAEGQKPDEHDDQWTVVGVLKRTHTSNDRVLFIPLVTDFCIAEHELGMEAQSKIRAAASGQPAPPGAPALPLRRPLPVPAPPAATAPADEHDHHDEGHKEHDAHDEHKEHAADAKDHDAGAEHKDHDAHADHKDDDVDHTDHDAHHADDGHKAGEPDAAEHHHDEKNYTVNADGTVEPHLPKGQWLISAILVKTREVEVEGRRVSNPLPLKYAIDATGNAVAVMPAQVMSEFFNQILAAPSMIILLVCALVTVVAAVGILVSIYNSVSARKREIAILRALGATRGKVLALICVEAGIIGLVGGALGLVVGHGIAAAANVYMERLLGQGFNWMSVGWEELAYLAGVVVIAVLAGLVPALKAYRTPVATNLVAT
jgi:putative ABC transport system permease protein